MTQDVHFDVRIDRDTNQLHVEREFQAPLPLVWNAYTTPEILDQWWAPKPYRTRTNKMDFREGGLWLYTMIAPDAQEHHCRMDYTKLSMEKSYEGVDAFCLNVEGDVNDALPSANVMVQFESVGERTMVRYTTTYSTPEHLETVVNMGIKEGLTMAMENLDALLRELQ